MNWCPDAICRWAQAIITCSFIISMQQPIPPSMQQQGGYRFNIAMPILSSQQCSSNVCMTCHIDGCSSSSSQSSSSSTHLSASSTASSTESKCLYVSRFQVLCLTRCACVAVIWCRSNHVRALPSMTYSMILPAW